MCILDNSSDHYLVVHPDTLVSGTTVSMATKCLRQSILNERFRTEGQNEAMLIGTLLHDLFDLAMEFNGEYNYFQELSSRLKFLLITHPSGITLNLSFYLLSYFCKTIYYCTSRLRSIHSVLRLSKSCL